MEFGVLRPFGIRLARMIGRGQHDAAIDHMRSGLRGDESDVASLQMIALCHHWAGRNDQAIASYREALAFDPASFDSHAQLAELLADKGEHEDAATHARKGLEHFPEPMEELPRVFAVVYKALCRIVPRLRRADPDGRLPDPNESNSKWFTWARDYLAWYDANFDESEAPTKH